ncbi:replication initiation protein [Planococcus plakortidis]|uniref:replication initiation protein n=1 Tax=Planococcus plakortidis TaxID=1038856 RepID=UPI00385DE8FF
MNKKHIVTQAHNLIEARHNNPLTVREQKIVLTMASMIEPNDEDFKDYRISIREFSEMLGLEGKTKYTEVKEISKELMSKTIEIPQEDGGWLLVHWISSAKYIKGEGVLELSFSPKLRPYMLQLKDHFTSYRLSNVLSLNSTYSIRLYELMKKWQKTGKWEKSVEDLKLQFGVPEDSYKRYNHFKTRVLLRAVEEVNEKTDLFIKIREIKKGRSVEKIEFIIRYSPKKEIRVPRLENNSESVEGLSWLDESKARMNELAEGYQFDTAFFAQLHQGASLIWRDDAEQELEFLIRYVNEEKSVKNPLGFIKSKITSAWEIHEAGGRITFADLQPVKERWAGREEKLPDWFTSKDEPVEPSESNPELAKEKEKLLKKLAEKKKRTTKDAATS